MCVCAWNRIHLTLEWGCRQNVLATWAKDCDLLKSRKLLFWVRHLDYDNLRIMTNNDQNRFLALSWAVVVEEHSNVCIRSSSSSVFLSSDHHHYIDYHFSFAIVCQHESHDYYINFLIWTDSFDCKSLCSFLLLTRLVKQCDDTGLSVVEDGMPVKAELLPRDTPVTCTRKISTYLWLAWGRVICQ